jgi:serine/threonine-protein kinase
MAEREDNPFTEPPSSDEVTNRISIPPVELRPPKLCEHCGNVPVTPGTPCDGCGAQQPDESLTVVVDGRYRLESEIGRGGMGVVYRASDTWLDRPVALKMIAPVWANSAEALTSLHREAKALASIRSQYVVQVYAFGVYETSYFFAMEYVSGGTLRQILQDHRMHGDTIPVHRTVTILDRIAQGIEAVHAAGILHRDVKPANVVIEEQTGRPVLVDFGLAVPSDGQSAALAMGTPQYMAPEQAGVGLPGAVVGTATDVYSLGMTAYEMFTGQLPFDSADHVQLMRQHARKKPAPLSSVRKGLEPFNGVIAKALAKDPSERFSSAAELAAALSRAAARWEKSTTTTLVPPPPEASAVAPVVSLQPGSPRPVHVLAVDDSFVFRRFTGKAAQLAFFRQRKDVQVLVVGAGSGAEAVERARVQIPDLLLLDFDMPGIDGADTLSKLRALPGGGDIRVVVISGRVSAGDRWRFTVLGVSDFVAKPIEFEQLVERIEGIAIRYGMVPRVPVG